MEVYVSVCAVDFFFTHRAVVVTSAQCIGIGTRIHFEQLREDCVLALTDRNARCTAGWQLGLHNKISGLVTGTHTNVSANKIQHLPPTCSARLDRNISYI